MATSKNLSVHAVISRGSELLASYVSAMFQLCFQRVPRYSIVIYFQSIFHGFQMGILSILYLIFSVFFSIISMEFFKVAHRNCSDVHVFQYYMFQESCLAGRSSSTYLAGRLAGSRNLAQNAFPDAWRVVPGLPSCIWRTGPSVIFVYYTRIVFARPGFRKFRPCVNIA